MLTCMPCASMLTTFTVSDLRLSTIQPALPCLQSPTTEQPKCVAYAGSLSPVAPTQKKIASSAPYPCATHSLFWHAALPRVGGVEQCCSHATCMVNQHQLQGIKQAQQMVLNKFKIHLDGQTCLKKFGKVFCGARLVHLSVNATYHCASDYATV